MSDHRYGEAAENGEVSCVAEGPWLARQIEQLPACAMTVGSAVRALSMWPIDDSAMHRRWAWTWSSLCAHPSQARQSSGAHVTA